MLNEYGITQVEAITGLRRNGLACPALPTCGLALTEAERVLPHIFDEIEGVLEETGLIQEPIVLRMTGCPNGCARPYVAELALVGRSPGKYVIYLGGNAVGTRLARLVSWIWCRWTNWRPRSNPSSSISVITETPTNPLAISVTAWALRS